MPDSSSEEEDSEDNSDENSDNSDDSSDGGAIDEEGLPAAAATELLGCRGAMRRGSWLPP